MAVYGVDPANFRLEDNVNKRLLSMKFIFSIPS